MRKNYNGFSLIELLFVIAIIGVLASLGVSMAEKKTEEFKIKKAALQVQYVLEAGLSYYADSKAWPLDGYSQPFTENEPPAQNCTEAKATDFRKFCDSYLGPSLKNDPWGGQPYSWRTQTIGNDRSTGRFSVLAKTPNVHIAERLAALLPYGEYCQPSGNDWKCAADPDPNRLWVRAYANIPGQIGHMNASGFGTVSVQADGSTKNVACSEVKLPGVSCEGIKKPHLFASIGNLYKFSPQGKDQFPQTGAWFIFKNDPKGVYNSQTYIVSDGGTNACSLSADGKYDCTFKFCVRRAGRDSYGRKKQGKKHIPSASARANYFIVCN